MALATGSNGRFSDLDPVLELWVDEQAARTAVVLDGRFDITTAAEVRSVLASVIERGRPQVVLDMAKVASIDTDALTVLAAALRRAEEAGREMVLLASTPPVRRALEGAGIAVADA